MFKYSAVLLFAMSSIAFGSDSISMDKVTIEERVNTISVKDVSAQEIKSADLAEALGKNIPSVTLIRRSGIANDIILRGQKRDNINIIIDGTKVCGACVNRMDPPTSHVATNLVDNVQVQEGPFDVENFGTLSGVVNISTQEPQEGFGGKIGLSLGSFGYQKASVTLSGGNEKIKLLISGAKEKGEQYEDGDGNDFNQQLINATVGTTSEGTQYQSRYASKDAFEKTTFMAKIVAAITEDQDIKLSFTGNRSDDVLYPSSKMDAIYDDSDLINVEYQIRNLSAFSKVLDFQYYDSEVDHPMSIEYRKKAVATNPKTGKPYGNITNHLTTKIQGVKIKNSFDALYANFTIGLDGSKREWDGQYYKDVGGDYMKFPAGGSKGQIKRSLNDVITDNMAIFLKSNYSIDNIDIDFGARYDDTTIENGGNYQENDYNALSANVFATINMGNDLRYFGGVGKSSRVPDPRELYFMSSMSPDENTLIGTPSLDQTTNYEIDLGFEKVYDSFSIKTKLFYSMLEDYIYINSSKNKNIFENIDATIYGAEISGAYLATDSFYIDYGISYKKGEKDDLQQGLSDKDLADISPLKAIIGLNYDYDDTLSSKLTMTSVADWEDFDSDNGEQALDGYTTFNLKVNKDFDNGLSLVFGVDNILDETYTTTNTYKDLTLITTGSAIDNIMLFNEPGRYFYINGSYKF